MTSYFEDAQKLTKIKIGEEKRGIASIKIESITRGDRFVQTLDIEYMDLVDDPYRAGEKKRRREKFLLPPTRGYTIDVTNITGAKSEIHHFPIQIFDEVWTSTPVSPYMGEDGKTILFPAKLRLVTISDIWGINGIILEKDDTT